MTRQRRQRLLFSLMALVVVLAAVELGAFVLLSAATGQIQSHAEIRAAALARTKGAADGGAADAGGPEEPQAHVVPAQLHPYLGFSADPTRHAAALQPFHHRRSIALGFPRNRDDLLQRPAPGKIVVGVFGGSFAHGLTRGGLEPITRRLSGLERFAGREVVVLDIAMGSFKQPQQLMALCYFLVLGAHFDVVINVDGFNEVALPATKNVPEGVAPSYPSYWSLLAGDLDAAARQLVGEISYLERRRRDLAAAFSGSGWRYSMTAAALWRVADRKLAADVARARLELDARGAGPSARRRLHGPPASFASGAAMFADLARIWGRASIQMHELCRGLGIEYYHFLQPNQYLPGSKPLSERELEIAYRAGHPYRRAVEQGYPQLVREGRWLHRQGVGFHDLTLLFAGRPETLYRDHCCHVNDAGNELVLAAVARVIAERPPGGGPESRP